MLRLLGVAAAAVTLWFTFRHGDKALIRNTLRSIGPLFLLVPLPELGWLLAEALGWQWGFRVLGRDVKLATLLRVRFSMEAIGTTLPGGVLLAESLAPYLLREQAAVSVSEGVTCVLARKFLLLASQSAYMLLIFLVGRRSLSISSERLLGHPGLAWLVLASAIVLGGAALLARLTLHRGAVVARLYRGLRQIPGSHWHSQLERYRCRFLQTDDEMVRFFGTRKRHLSALAVPFLVAWWLESVETWLLLILVGVHLDFVTVASFEVVIVLLFRHIMFLLPAGLGAQDAGYVAFLSAFGIANPVSVGAAFVVLKRGKELVWASIGYACLLLGRRRGGVSAPGVKSRGGELVPSESGAAPPSFHLSERPDGTSRSAILPRSRSPRLPNPDPEVPEEPA